LWRQGAKPPLFLVHGRHGQAFISPHFMRLLGDDQPVFVFQARGLDGVSAPHPTVEAMAADYVAELRKVRPAGPYFIGSLCAGASALRYITVEPPVRSCCVPGCLAPRVCSSNCECVVPRPGASVESEAVTDFEQLTQTVLENDLSSQ